MTVDAVAIVSPGWICALALGAVMGDAFLPFLPSGTLVILAVLQVSRITDAPLLLGLGVAIASFIGDVLLLALARRGAPTIQRRLEHRPRLAAGVQQMQRSLSGRTGRAAGTMVVIARFVPAGRTVLDVAIGHSPEHGRGFLRWSALAALVWAAYIVSLGWLDSRWFDTAWLSVAVSCAAATAISAALARLARRRNLVAP